MKSIKVSCGQYYGLSFVESNPHKIRKEHTFLFCYFHCKTAPANAVEFFGHRLLSRISILNALNQTETIFSSEKFIHILVCLLSFLPSTFSHPVEVGGWWKGKKNVRVSDIREQFGICNSGWVRTICPIHSKWLETEDIIYFYCLIARRNY